MLLVLSFSGASRSCYDCGGGRNNATCMAHVPRSVNTSMRPHGPRDVGGHGGGAFEVDW